MNEKASLFNEYFANQHTVISTSSELPPFAYAKNLGLEIIIFNEMS